MHCRFVRLSLKKLRRKRDRRVSTSKVGGGRCSAASIWESDSSSRFWRSSSSSLGDEDDDEEGLSISEASQSLPEINPEPPTHIVLLDIVQDPTR